MFEDLGGEMNALIFNGTCGDAVRSYSSIRLTRSSSEVMETKASRSSAGNWQRRCVTDEPQSSSSFGSSSVTIAITVISICKKQFHYQNVKFNREREITDRKNEQSDRRRRHVYGRRGSGVCRRDNEGGFCLRSYRGI